MLNRPCVQSSGNVDGPIHTLESFEGGDMLEPKLKNPESL